MTNKSNNTYFETLTGVVDGAQVVLDEADAVLLFGTLTTPTDDHWTNQIFKDGHLAYGQTRGYNFEIFTLKGRPTRKWFHISIYRLDSGRYELTTYIL